MSLARKRGAARAEYAGYLRSSAWLSRKIRFYEALAEAGFVAVCQVCGARKSKATPLDLHHLSYEGVKKLPGGQWVSSEADEDLIPLCREHHQQLHQILDTRGRDYRGWSRKKASLWIIYGLKKKVGGTR